MPPRQTARARAQAADRSTTARMWLMASGVVCLAAAALLVV